jgi:hypothetical protein
MRRSYMIIGTVLCLLTAFANFTGWKVLASPTSSWGPKGASTSGSFRHK